MRSLYGGIFSRSAWLGNGVGGFSVLSGCGGVVCGQIGRQGEAVRRAAKKAYKYKKCVVTVVTVVTALLVTDLYM